MDINNYLAKEQPNTFRYYFNNAYKNKQNKNININNKTQKNKSLKNIKKITIFDNYLNKKNSIKNGNLHLNKKLNFNDKCKAKNLKEKILKKSLNKPNLIKKIEFLTLNTNNNPNSNNNNGQDLSFNKNIDTNSSYRTTNYKTSYNQKKILNISFNNKKKQIENEKHNISTYSSIYKNNYLNYKKNKKVSLKKIKINENKFKNGNNSTKNNKKVKIKKIDFLKQSNTNIDNDNNEKQLLILNNDVERLIKENNIIKEKTNKKFRFCKSTKKNNYKNININEFTKDFLIIPKQYSNKNIS